jgi:hypothetical protein
MYLKYTLTLLFIFLCAPIFAQYSSEPYDTNLIKNYNAEAIGENTIPNWKPLAEMETWYEMANAYGSATGEWQEYCDEKCGLPPNAGTRYFRIPINAAYPHLGLMQSIDLEPFRDTLAERKMQFTVSGYIAGVPAMNPECSHGVVAVKFYDNGGMLLDTKEFKKDSHTLEKMAGVDGRMYKFVPFMLTDEIPKGTAKAILSIEGQLAKENCNGGYTFYDNLRFAVTKGVYRKDVR